MLIGVLAALAAGLMWGLVFVGPLLLPDYPAAALSFGRYLAFGVIALPLALLDRARLAQLTRADWLEAAKLGAVGNVLYYLALSSAIQRAGGPMPTMIIGTIPVVVAIVTNLRRDPATLAREGRMPWRRIALPIALIALGLAAVHHAESAHHAAGGASQPAVDEARYLQGALLAVLAVACWTWYPIRNADWLRSHPDRSPRAWATAQGLATFPLALVGLLGWWAWTAAAGGATTPAGAAFAMPLGPRPAAYLALMFTIGLLASWLGTLCWNEASQRLPTALVGQLIVFETLAALAYAFLLRGAWPDAATFAGVALLVGGVVLALRVRPQRV